MIFDAPIMSRAPAALPRGSISVRSAFQHFRDFGLKRCMRAARRKI